MTDETMNGPFPVEVDPIDPSPKGVPLVDAAGSNVVAIASPAPGSPAKRITAPQPDPFTQSDANNILIILERAPLQNLQESRNLMGSINRFVQFINANVPA